MLCFGIFGVYYCVFRLHKPHPGAACVRDNLTSNLQIVWARLMSMGEDLLTMGHSCLNLWLALRNDVIRELYVSSESRMTLL
jgi:hypothetical protein